MTDHDKELERARLAIEAAILARGHRAKLELLRAAAFRIQAVIQDMEMQHGENNQTRT